MSEDILLPGGWRLWEQFALRGPGFPAAGVLRLAPEGLGAAADRFTPADQLTGPAWDAFRATFADAAVDTARELQRIAAEPRFRAAVAWQNRTVLDTGIAPFLKWTPSAAGRTSMPRQREELVAHYWQRFCVKNDTIGFFGPVGWGRLDPAHTGLTIDPGDRLIAQTATYYSSWAIDALAATIAEDPRLRPWIPPRRASYVRLTGTTATIPGRRPYSVTPLEHRLLTLCDGSRTLADLAGEVAGVVEGRTGGAGADEITAALGRLAERRLITWRLHIPADTHPQDHLRAYLERITDAEPRQEALARLDALEAARAKVTEAAVDPLELPGALAALERTFAELTRSASTREKGARTAMCRALVYSDSRRAATARVGSAVLEELTPLALCLMTARWMTNRVADAARERVREVYERLLERDGSVDLGSLWFGCLPAPYPRWEEDVDRIQREMRAHWARIIDAPPGARRVRLTSAQIADRVREIFDEPGRGWNLARYISPDLIVVADDAHAVERGEFELLLGELHVALNTVAASLFVMQHPDRGSLLAETERDFPGPRALPMLYKEGPRWSARSRPALLRPDDYLVGLVDYTADPHRPRVVMSADVTVADDEGKLVVVLPDGARFDLLDVYANALTNRVMDRFNLRQDGDHAPRVTIDRMVVARETWRMPAAELAFADDKDEARRFVRARHWRDEHRMPRHVFVVSPTEPRPFYVDFDSPVYVNILAKAARRLARKDPEGRLSVTEMLPDPGQTWLTDHEGNAYTSELRLIAVDQTSRAGAPVPERDAVAAEVPA
jgi:hypothetical protein